MKYTVTGLVILLFSQLLVSRPVINLQKSTDGYIFDYEISQWQVTDVDTLGLHRELGFGSEIYTRISVPDFTASYDIGKAELPLLSFYFALPAPDQLPEFVVINRTDEQILLTNRIYPAQVPWPKSRPLTERPFSCNAEYYSSTGEKGPLARVDETFSIRGIPCIRVEIAPFFYNPRENRITVTRKFTLKIKTSNGRKYHKLSSHAFEKYFRYVLVNFNDVVEPVPDRNGKDDYCIITAPAYESELREFAKFRH